MSRYIEFFTRVNDTYIPLISYCSSSKHMQAFNYLVTEYSGLTLITHTTLKRANGVLNDNIKQLDEEIARAKEENTLIIQANNSLEEKYDFIKDNNNFIEDCKKERNQCITAQHDISFLHEMLDEVEYNERCQECGIDEQKYMYAGIEPIICKDECEITDEERQKFGIA